MNTVTVSSLSSCIQILGFYVKNFHSTFSPFLNYKVSDYQGRNLFLLESSGCKCRG